MNTTRFLQVEDRDNLIRDSITGAVINIDDTGLTKAREKAMKIYQEKRKFQELEMRVEKQEQTLNEIKELLIKALEK